MINNNYKKSLQLSVLLNSLTHLENYSCLPREASQGIRTFLTEVDKTLPFNRLRSTGKNKQIPASRLKELFMLTETFQSNIVLLAAKQLNFRKVKQNIIISLGFVDKTLEELKKELS